MPGTPFCTMRNSIPVLLSPHCPFTEGKVIVQLWNSFLLYIFPQLCPNFACLLTDSTSIVKSESYGVLWINPLPAVQCLINDVNEGCGSEVYLKSCAYAPRFWPDEWAHASAFLYEPHWSWSLYCERQAQRSSTALWRRLCIRPCDDWRRLELRCNVTLF